MNSSNSDNSILSTLDSFPANEGEFSEQQIQFLDYIQPHGMLIALEESNLQILQVSQNISALFKIPAEECLGKPLKNFFSKSQINKIKQFIRNDFANNSKLIKFRIKSGNKYILLDGIIHRNPDKILILELEYSNSKLVDVQGYFSAIHLSVQKSHQTQDFQELCQLIAQEVRNLIKFDRVMIYKFDQDCHGEVIAENKREDLTSFLGFHYPAEDTAPCRHVYGVNWSRLIHDISAPPVQLIPSHSPITNAPLNLLHSHLRGVDICHVEYLRQMGVQAALSMSVMKDNQLWGMILGHHYSPKHPSYEVCQACEFLAQMLSFEIITKEKQQDYEYQIKLKSLQTKLTESLSTDDIFFDSFVQNKSAILDLVGAQGAVILWDDYHQFLGETPEQEQVIKLLEWVKKEIKEDCFFTHHLISVYPPAESFYQEGSGLLVISISDQKHILWFRPEFIQTVTWGRDPNVTIQPVQTEEDLYARPKQSFQTWKELVKYQSLPWKSYEIEAAKELRKNLINIVIRKVKELEKLNQELATSNKELEKFAYVASHDLQEPLNLVSSYVQLLEMRYEDQLDQDAKDFIGFAVEGVSHMQTLIDDLLAYSRVGSRGKPFKTVELGNVKDRVVTNLQKRISENLAIITHDPLPTIIADETQLTQLFQNLIGNAIKFQAEENPKIHIGVTEESQHWIFSVQDNGIGIDHQFAERIFVIFQRLHNRDHYPGTGIGLAICKKIVERHGGKIWLQSKLGQGSTFYFSIPKREENSV